MGAFRKGLYVGFAWGYMKGAKAGRERYEQINKKLDKIKSTATYQRASAKAQQLVGFGLYRGKLVALDAVGKASQKIRNPVTKNGHETKNSPDFTP